MVDCKFLAFGVVFLHTLVLTFCSDHQTDVLRVAGGLPGNIVTFPWQVSLQYRGRHDCGGSIISSQWILSAAHCTYERDINRLMVRVGTSWHDAFGEIINISQIVDHPKYSHSPTYDYDFSLIQLSRPLTFDQRIQPIELPDEDTNIADGTLCMVSGWGVTGNLSESRDFLRKVEVPIINQDECKKLWSHLTPQMICAGYAKEGGKDACNGDSGGALRCFHEKNDSNRLLLIGVVSFGAPCNETYTRFGTGGYARVTSVRKWIESVSGI